MKKAAVLLSLSILPYPARAITTYVEAGEVVDGGDVHSVVTQQVYGEANNFTVSGNQQIMKGGVAHNSNVYPYGQQNVERGGEAYNAKIQYSGIQNVKGTAWNTTIDNRGSMNVYNGGVSNGASVGGTLSVQKGGTALDTIVNSGTEYVSGMDKNAQINGGTQQIKYGGRAENAVVSGGKQRIESGGTAENTKVESGSVEVLGDALQTVVQPDGTLLIMGGGYAENTLLDGGTMDVSGSAFAQNTVINSGEQDVFGTDISGSIHGGVQRVQSGGTAENAEVDGSGIQRIYKNGFAWGTKVSGGGTVDVRTGGNILDAQILSGGKLTVAGTSENGEVASGGSMSVESGGTAVNTKLNGGVMEVKTGALSQKTNIVSGTQNIYGRDENSALSGGIQTIKNGGTAFGTHISNNGVQQVEQGGETSEITVADGGRQIVYGKITQTKIAGGGTVLLKDGSKAAETMVSGGVLNVEKGAEALDGSVRYGGTEAVSGNSLRTNIGIFGTQNVKNGGLSQNAQINFWGKQNVEKGGIAEDSQINFGGVQNVYGEAVGAIVNGGRQNVGTGGKAVATKINSGILTVYDSGEAVGADVKKGWLILHSGGNLSGRTKVDGGIVSIYGDNKIPDIELNKTLVNIGWRPQYTTLHIDNLNGSGVFNMSSNLAAEKSDTLSIAAGDGSFGLIVHDYSMMSAPSKYKIIDENNAAHDSFYLVGGGMDVGAFRYDLRQENGDWFLVKTGQLSDSSYIAKNTYSSLSSLFYTHLSPVYNRLRLSRKNTENDNGLWVKSLGRKIKFHYKDDTRSSINVYGGAVGFDHNILKNGLYRLKLGAYTGYTDSRQKYDRAGRGDGETQSLGLYTALINENKWFVDVVGTYFWHDQKIKSYTPAGYDVDGKYKTESWQASASAGKRWDFAGKWFVEPSAGFSYMHIDGISYRTNFNTLVQASDAGFFSGNVGFSGGRAFNFDNGASLDAYGRFGLIYDWDGKSRVQVADYTFEEDISSLRYELGAGVNVSWGNGSAYLETSSWLGDQVDIPWEISVGWQYEF